jgi:hypothetical protein
MKDLTTKQKEIIDSLTKEFVELNNQNPNESFNVIDINSLRGEVDQINIVKKELAIYNDAMVKAHNAMVEDFCDKLNEDFKKGKFPIIAKIYKTSAFEIEIEYFDMKNVMGSDWYNDKVHMHVTRKAERVMYGLNDIGSKTLSYQFSAKYDSCRTSEDKVYSSPQLFFNDEKVRNRIVRLIRMSEHFVATGTRLRG